MSDKVDYIYLDNNSTTPLDKDVRNAISEACLNLWANPSSASALGREAKEKIELARKKVARCVECRQENVIFTSGGTEGNNMVIYSCIKYGKDFLHDNIKPHVITSSAEHDATLNMVRHLENLNEIELTIIPMEKNGSISSKKMFDSIKNNTCIISLMMANNESGIIFPVAQIGRNLRKLNEERRSQNLCRIFLHTDSAQTVGKIPVKMGDLNVDYITIVGHKFYGPRIGAVCRMDSDSPLSPILYGGGQEFGLRPGTENTPMIIGLGEACEIVENNLTVIQLHLKQTCDYLLSQLVEKFGEDVSLNFDNVEKLPNTLSVCFIGVSGRALLEECPRVIASTGSACHSSLKTFSRVLSEVLDERTVQGTLRLSVGRSTTFDEIDMAVNLLRSAYLKLRQK